MKTVLLVATLAVLTPASYAGVDVSFGANVPVGDDGHLFFNISSHYFDREPAVVQTWAPRYSNPDDFAVSMWIAQRSGRSPDFVFSLRHSGMPWIDVGVRCGVPAEAWYVPVPAERVAPPYGHAYGYWAKHNADPHYAIRFNDHDARDLVAMRMAHEYYGVSPEVAMQWRHSDGNIQTMMARRYRDRHEHEGGDHDAQGHDQDHGHGHGHGNGHGHDKDHGHEGNDH